MRQSGLILAAGRVRSKKKNEKKTKSRRTQKHARLKMHFFLVLETPFGLASC